MDFIDSMIMTRASVRSFTGEALPEEALLRIAKAGMAAPSAVNIQPWEIIIVTDREKLDRLREVLPYAKMLDKAGAAIVVCGNPEKDKTMARRFWVQDCSAMSENILLAAHALGLGAVWTAVYPEEERMASVRGILGIPRDFIPLNVIPIGVIAGAAPAPRDKWNPQALHFNAW